MSLQESIKTWLVCMSGGLEWRSVSEMGEKGGWEDGRGDGSRYLILFSLSLPLSFHEMLTAYGGCAARWQMTLLNVGRGRRRRV